MHHWTMRLDGAGKAYWRCTKCLKTVTFAYDLTWWWTACQPRPTQPKGARP